MKIIDPNAANLLKFAEKNNLSIEKALVYYDLSEINNDSLTKFKNESIDNEKLIEDILEKYSVFNIKSLQKYFRITPKSDLGSHPSFLEKLENDNNLIKRDSLMHKLIQGIIGNVQNIVLVGKKYSGRSSLVKLLDKLLKSSANKYVRIHPILYNKRIFKFNIDYVMEKFLDPQKIGLWIQKFGYELAKETNNQKYIVYIDDIDLLERSYKAHPVVRLLYKHFLRENFKLLYRANRSDIETLNELDVTDVYRIPVNEMKKDDVLKLLGNYELNDEQSSFIFRNSERLLNHPQPHASLHLCDIVKGYVKDDFKKANPGNQFDRDNIVNAISDYFDIEKDDIGLNYIDKLHKSFEDIKDYIVGQDKALDTIKQTLSKNSVRGTKDRPVGSFLFVGTSGMGKTETAKQMARSLYDKDAFLRIDMSEYAEKHTLSSLLGSPPGYVGYNEGGILSNFLTNHYRGIILFDEVEKAHDKVLAILLQMLDYGHVKDRTGKEYSCNNHIITATSNASVDVQEQVGFDKTELSEEKINKLYSHFRPELLNRFDNLVLFKNLSDDNLKKIAKNELRKVRKELESGKMDVNLSITNPVYSHVAEKVSKKDGRHISLYVDNVVYPKILNKVKDFLDVEKDIKLCLRNNQLTLI